MADSRGKTQAALNAYRDYIQKSVNAGLADARNKVQISFNDLRGLLQANFNQTVSGANESLATLRDSTNRGLETLRSGEESGINASAEKLRASVEDAFNTLIPTLWAMEGMPEGVLMTPAIYRNVTPTGFEVLSLGKMTVSYLAVGLKV